MIYEELNPETKQGMKGGWHNNKSKKLENDTMSFSKDTAGKVGATERTIEFRKVAENFATRFCNLFSPDNFL